MPDDAKPDVAQEIARAVLDGETPFHEGMKAVDQLAALIRAKLRERGTEAWAVFAGEVMGLGSGHAREDWCRKSYALGMGLPWEELSDRGYTVRRVLVLEVTDA